MSALLKIAIVVIFLWACFTPAEGLQCYQCGQYNDGVGSITPCINYTEVHRKECPSKTAKYCIKYVSKLSTVRDCVSECTEKEVWESSTYCCNEDGCNNSNRLDGSTSFMLVPATLIAALASLRY